MKSDEKWIDALRPYLGGGIVPIFYDPVPEGECGLTVVCKCGHDHVGGEICIRCDCDEWESPGQIINAAKTIDSFCLLKGAKRIGPNGEYLEVGGS